MNTLDHSHDYFQRLTNSLADAVFLIKLPERVIEWANDPYQVLGYEPDECIGETTQKFYSDPADFEVYGALVTEAIQSGVEVLTAEALLRRKDAEIIPVEMRGTIFREGGQAASLTVLVRNITDRKRVQEALKASEKRFRSLMEQSPVSIQIHGLDGNLLLSNAAYSRLYALNEEALQQLYEKYNVLQDEQARELGVMSFIEQTYRGEEVMFPPYYYDGVDTLKTLDVNNPVSRQCWVQTRGFPLKDEHGSVTSVVFISEDISERKRSEQAMLDYQRRLKELAAELSRTEERQRRKIAAELHDNVGQSLAVLRMQLVSAKQQSTDRKVDEILDEVSDSLREAIKDTRSIISALSSPTLNELGLTAAISDWLREQIAGRYSLQTHFSDDGEPKPLSEDGKIILYGSVRELLMNVVKHASAHQVSVNLQRIDNGLQIIVEDDGVGLVDGKIPEQNSAEAGFGLFSIEERMKDIGGSLTLESLPGKGVRATLIAPLEND